MYYIKSNITGFFTFILIVVELIIGFGTLTIVNIPRAIFPFKSLKIKLSKISNTIGEYTVYGLKIIMKIMHRDAMQVFDNNEFDKNQWYMAVSNHQSWADIFILLVAAHKRIPLLKFFMKKELAWIPFVFLANKTLNMPFVNRHSKKQLEKNPNLRFKDYENTLLACKRFQRSPSTIFSYAEGTRNNSTKHKAQNSPYKNLLIPRVGGIATALSAMPNIDVLVDYSVVYKSDKRGAWAFLRGDMRDVKVSVKKYNIPEDLKIKTILQMKNTERILKFGLKEFGKRKTKKLKD
jgi:1-acyl-sn-glycerol-3-phosphate acyltransferase